MPPRRQKDQLDARKKRPEEGDYRAKCTRTREGRVRERERKDRKRRRQKGTERSETREGEGDMDLEEKRSTRTLWKQGQEIRGAVGQKLAVGDRGGRRKKPWKKNAEERSRNGRGATGL